MQRAVLTASILALLQVFSLAADLVWVVQEDGSGGMEFVEMLRTEGHQVSIIVVAGAPPTEDQISRMNAADLVIVSRKNVSGDPAYNTSVWNTEITAPLIAQNAYLLRGISQRWGWFEGGDLWDGKPSMMVANAPDHKVFEGIIVKQGLTHPWHFPIDRNTTLPLNSLASGGNLIASKSDSPADAPIVAEWPAGTVAAGPRMMFLAGARDAIDAQSIGEDFGRFNLTEIGQIAFLNAVSYYAGPWASRQLWAPLSKSLGQVSAGCSPTTVTIALKNLGLEEAVQLSNVSVSGPSSHLVTVVSYPNQLDPTKVGEIVVRVAPQGYIGDLRADLILHNDSTLTSLQQRRIRLEGHSIYARGPFLSYNFDDDSPNVVNDTSGNGRDGVYTVGVSSVYSQISTGGQSLHFSEGSLITAFQEYSPQDGITVSLWIQLDTNEGQQMIFSMNSGPASQTALYQRDGDLYLYSGYQDLRLGSSELLHPSQIYHLAITLPSFAETAVYLDGEKLSSVDPLPEVNYLENLTSFTVGAFGTLYPLKATVDDVQVYDRLLTLEEITAIASNAASFADGCIDNLEPPSLIQESARSTVLALPQGLRVSVDYSTDMDFWKVLSRNAIDTVTHSHGNASPRYFYRIRLPQ